MDINNKKPSFQLTEKDDNGKILFNEDFYLIREYIAKQKIELGLKTYINVLGEVFFKSKNNMIDSNFATVRNDVHFCSQINDLTNFGNAFSIDNVELGNSERRSHFVFYHFHLGAVTGYVDAIFQLTDSADVKSN